MKPPPFRYHAPTTLDEAIERLAEAGEDGKVLAGGQSLIPLMNMRLAAPGVLIDINRVSELDTIEAANGTVRVGAGARHATLERHQAACAAQPLLSQALAHVAHPVIRNRGTVVGSVVHADPAAELPAVLALLDGEVTLASRDRGVRTVRGAEFFVGPLESVTAAGELATEVRFPALPAATGTAFEELARRHGDYAMAGVAVLVSLDDDDRLAAARASFIGVGGTPISVDLAQTCAGQPADRTDFSDAVAHARAAIDPTDDIHATADYRRHLSGVLLDRALTAATARAVDAKGRT